MKAETTILRRDISPFVQGGFILGLMLFFHLIVWILEICGMDLGETISWEISLTLLLFFALGNSVFFLNTKEKGKYWSYSITSFIVVAAASIGLSRLISGFGLSESGSIKWIYFIFSFSYLIFISIIGLMRRIVEIAIKQDKRLRGEQ